MQKYYVDFTDKIPPNVILALAPKLSSDSSLHTMIGDLNPTISKSLSATTIPIVSKKTWWSCHKDVLRSSSNYFKSIFNSQLHEVEVSIVFLPNGIFSASVLDIMLYYMYNKSIFIEDETDIEVLQSLYLASDYLGLESLCATIEQHITINLAHSFNCYCENCITIVPFLLSFAGSNQQNNPSLSKMVQSIVKLLIQDPERVLSTFWTSQSMVTLLTQNPEMELLHEYLENGLLKHVNKSNAIECLFGCFLAEEVLIKKRKEFQTKLLEGTIQKVRESGSSILANKFDFYCTKYPKLLSCVDGITYSFDFLNYMMSVILDQQMNERNACLLYEGVVKHLMCRHTFQNSPLVRTILQSAKEKIIKYISSNIITIKKLDLIDQTIIDSLTHDLIIPVDALTEQDVLRHKQSIIASNTNTSENRKCSYQHIFGWNINLFRKRFSFFFIGQHFKIGQRVQLLNTPIAITGTIAFVGKIIVKGIKKQYEHRLGIELDQRVGFNDGSINGKRYFITSPNRGVFVKPTDVVLL